MRINKRENTQFGEWMSLSLSNSMAQIGLNRSSICPNWPLPSIPFYPPSFYITAACTSGSISPSSLFLPSFFAPQIEVKWPQFAIWACLSSLQERGERGIDEMRVLELFSFPHSIAAREIADCSFIRVSFVGDFKVVGTEPEFSIPLLYLLRNLRTNVGPFIRTTEEES